MTARFLWRLQSDCIMSEPLAIVVAAKALDGLQMRMAALAHNAANVGTPRFQPLQVDFEGTLRAAARHGAIAVRDAAFEFIAGPVQGLGDERRLDLILADASATAARYAAVSDMLGRRLAIGRAALGAQG
jgi:flagellar basal-body rod protein FlgB